MYDIIYKDGLYWITYNDVILEDLGGFIEFVSPKIIIQEIKDEV